MNCRSVTIEGIKHNNPRLCLSPKRYLNKCFDCSMYPTCESRIPNEEFDRKLKELRGLREEVEKKRKEIKELGLQNPNGYKEMR